jgi:hypothetical protein
LNLAAHLPKNGPFPDLGISPAPVDLFHQVNINATDLLFEQAPRCTIQTDVMQKTTLPVQLNFTWI